MLTLSAHGCRMIGQVISHYRILQKLGAGGMGEVFLAEDRSLARRVALKLLPEEYTQDPERLRRFRLEARAVSALNHPNILTIHEVGASDGQHYIVTEFVDGESLGTRLTRLQALPEDEALRIASQVASALAAAHGAGIIHRDIKPENVMLRPDGWVKVLDFGLAKLLDTATRSVHVDAAGPEGPVPTQSGVVLGTTDYMSPEQATGGSVDARSDVFSLGVLLYEMVVGQRPFRRSSPMLTVAALLTEEPDALPAVVNPELGRTILRCLRKEPARRYQSMTDLKAALEDLLAERASAPRVRNRSRGRWIAATLTPVVLLAMVLAWRTWWVPPIGDPLSAVPLTTLPGVARYPSFSPNGDRVAFTWTGASQDNPDVYIQQIGAGAPFRLTSHPANDFNPAWSPDGRWIAFLRSQSDTGVTQLMLVAPLGGPERTLTEIRIRSGLTGLPPYLTWCPDSSCLIVTASPGEERPDALFAISLETGERRQLTNPQPPSTGDTNPAISPDGRWLVFRRMAGTFVGALYALRLGRNVTPSGEPAPLTRPELDAQHPAWLPNGKEIVFVARSALWRVRVPGSREPARLPYVGDYALTPAVSRQTQGKGSRLVYVRSFDDMNIWRVQTAAAGAVAAGTPVGSISSTRSEPMPQFSPDGRRVAFTSDRTGNWEIWLADPDGSNSVQLTTMRAVASGYPHWSPDGRSIVFHSNVAGQWDVYLVPSSGGRPRNVTAHAALDGFPSFSRDGKWIYFSSNRASGQYQTVWKIPTSGGAAVQVSAMPGYAPTESPDGKDVYWVETLDGPGALWRRPVSGGPAVKVLEGVALANYAVRAEGIYYIDRASGGSGIHYRDVPTAETRLRYYDFRTRRTVTVASGLGRVDVPLTVSPDGRAILFPRTDLSVNDLMLVENFR